MEDIGQDQSWLRDHDVYSTATSSVENRDAEIVQLKDINGDLTVRNTLMLKGDTYDYS